uniref:Ribosomal protein S14 n=1 Tax=Ulva fasciata TaxID=111617 RepID=A0A0U2L5F9_9CHLO|nr:ribosomal protein S14 [Ulva fasciata]ALG35700.1 ribosomal protein S14 [Ulva fasciata]AML79976.1 ribosomal protein S14 [Ulva fasciata]QBR54766.1 ribosomal protein S14 [Ulva lactuca]
MALKNNYNFNTITKNQKFLGLLQKSKKSFSANLLDKNLLNLKAIFFNTKLDAGAVSSQKLKATTLNKGIKKIQDLSDWSNFVYTKRRTNSKKIQTRFRSIISDQKKRTAFDNKELIGTLLKSLLCADFSPKLQLDQLDLRFKDFNKVNLSYIGPGLILEQSINRRYTQKQGISNIRNRCIVTGRSSIIGKFRLSRISFRRYAGQGLIPGLVKRSH